MSPAAALLLAPLALAGAGPGADAGAGEADAGAPAGPVLPRARLADTSRAEDLSVERVVVVIDRRGDRMEIVETVTLASREGTRFGPRGRARLGLPPGAVAPKTPGEEGAKRRVQADGSGFVVFGPIGPEGEAFTLSFEVPIAGGAASFRQRFPSEIGDLQVICAWTRGRARLRVEGAGDGARRELESGLTALVARRPGFGRAQLSVEVSGVEDGAGALPRRVALALCAALFGAGLVAALMIARRRRGRERSG